MQRQDFSETPTVTRAPNLPVLVATLGRWVVLIIDEVRGEAHRTSSEACASPDTNGACRYLSDVFHTSTQAMVFRLLRIFNMFRSANVRVLLRTHHCPHVCTTGAAAREAAGGRIGAQAGCVPPACPQAAHTRSAPCPVASPLFRRAAIKTHQTLKQFERKAEDAAVYDPRCVWARRFALTRCGREMRRRLHEGERDR
jgi:hypothetical protein